ncbi:hypothetical protein B0H14DRAFT_2561013 [Mycena olivaceomarginata]|nr:hypothetical protein B0H14DRAFT_2561013 [Mycena olivaceomarginata]
MRQVSLHTFPTATPIRIVQSWELTGIGLDDSRNVFVWPDGGVDTVHGFPGLLRPELQQSCYVMMRGDGWDWVLEGLMELQLVCAVLSTSASTHLRILVSLYPHVLLLATFGSTKQSHLPMTSRRPLNAATTHVCMVSPRLHSIALHPSRSTPSSTGRRARAISPDGGRLLFLHTLAYPTTPQRWLPSSALPGPIERALSDTSSRLRRALARSSTVTALALHGGNPEAGVHPRLHAHECKGTPPSHIVILLGHALLASTYHGLLSMSTTRSTLSEYLGWDRMSWNRWDEEDWGRDENR